MIKLMLYCCIKVAAILDLPATNLAPSFTDVSTMWPTRSTWLAFISGPYNDIQMLSYILYILVLPLK